MNHKLTNFSLPHNDCPICKSFHDSNPTRLEDLFLLVEHLEEMGLSKSKITSLLREKGLSKKEIFDLFLDLSLD